MPRAAVPSTGVRDSFPPNRTPNSTMMVAGLSPALAPLPVLLLATTTTTVLRRAHGTPHTASSELDCFTDGIVDACGKELLSCLRDETCASCADLYGEREMDAELCRKVRGIDDAEPSMLSCPDLISGTCCYEELSTLDCQNNDSFMDFKRCYLGMYRCEEDGTACDGSKVVEESGAADGAERSVESTGNEAAIAVDFGRTSTAAVSS